MKEIEVKFQLREKSFEDVIAALRNKCELSDTIKEQSDAIYVFPEQLGRPVIAGSKIARVRTTKINEQIAHRLTLKVQTDTPMVSNEYEVTVDNGKEAENLLKGLGMVPRVVVTKKRLEGRTNKYEICIDEVVGLGVFIELEELLDDLNDKNIKKSQAEMKGLLKRLNLPGKINMVPYDTQIERKNADARRN